MTTLDRTKENPWRLKTPPGSSEYTMHVEEKDGKPRTCLHRRQDGP